MGSSSTAGMSNGGADNGQMSRSSFASFHLTGIKPSSGKMMTSSVDRLFENEGEVFLSSNYQDFQVSTFYYRKDRDIKYVSFQGLPSIHEGPSIRAKSPDPNNSLSKSGGGGGITDSTGGNASTATSTAKSSRRDSLTDKPNQQELELLVAEQPPLLNNTIIKHTYVYGGFTVHSIEMRIESSRLLGSNCFLIWEVFFGSSRFSLQLRVQAVH